MFNILGHYRTPSMHIVFLMCVVPILGFSCNKVELDQGRTRPCIGFANFNKIRDELAAVLPDDDDALATPAVPESDEAKILARARTRRQFLRALHIATICEESASAIGRRHHLDAVVSSHPSTIASEDSEAVVVPTFPQGTAVFLTSGADVTAAVLEEALRRVKAEQSMPSSN